LALVDERGRVFGKVNAIDLMVAVFCLLLVPLAYGAFVLFRTPDPKIGSVTPGTAQVGKADVRLKVTGTGFRPFLGAYVGTQKAALLVDSPSSAEVVLPANLPIGTYDLSFSDDSRDVAKAVGAITIVAPPAPPSTVLQVSGTFLSVSDATAKALTPGARFPAGDAQPLVEVLAVRPGAPVVMRVPTATGALERPMPGRVRMPAVLRIRCSTAAESCKVGEVAVAAGATITAEVGEAAPFQILDVNDADKSPLFDPSEFRQTVEVEVRFVTSPETLSLLTAGSSDLDRRLFVTETAGAPAVLRSFRRVTEVEGRTTVDWNGGDIRSAPNVINLPRPVAVIDATLVVPVARTLEGWQYKGVGIKVGGPFSIEGPFYMMRGWILSVRVQRPAAPAPAPGGKQ
jgi:hypothetical protein